ncbi:MAG: T9SS type A sorting domain-containing protein [Calditrichaeota bacterium]|nr:T9SS type A sorting domain-containing protein [Calditrichota bacterium]
MLNCRLISGIIVLLLAFQFHIFAQTNNLDTTISINPKQTYLRINNDPGTLDAIPLALDSLGISWGDSLMLQQMGDYDNGPGGDVYTAMIGVFSTNDSLLDPSQPHRVPGAIEAGEDYVSSPTWSGNLATDIPEDFRIDTTYISVPDSAEYIFVCAHDSKYGDNSDPDNDFGVRIVIIPPSTGFEGDILNMIRNDFHLSQNYPNPFNPSTTIEFDLPKTSQVSLRVFNILGEEVATLLSASLLSGSHSVEWDASQLSGGVYLYRLEAYGFFQTKKMILMR